MMQYRGLTLDKFQEDAVIALSENKSVVVSAPTGSGKTLIADCIIDIELKKGKRVVYTAPIKALSNQKYKEFSQNFGHHEVGIMTGDVVINSGAPLLIMTTEIYRNMLLVKDPIVQHISYVILDEVHYINDIERGTVWEESIIFSPPHVRFLALSATIPNHDELADWIRTIQKHEVIVIKHHHRPVPLRHMFYDYELGMTTLKEIKREAENTRYPTYKGRGRRMGEQDIMAPQHWMLIKDLHNQGLLPAIYFVFSRHETQQKAGWISKKNDFLDPKEKAEVAKQVSQYFARIDQQINLLNTTHLLKQCLARGVAFHHAGLLPNHKEIVENLFAQGLVKVLYATETFAVGINMPAKTVCFDSLEKYDGRSFRYLNSKEYFQLAGRAGRRGIDKEGLAVSLIHRKQSNFKKIEEFTSEDRLPITSQFKLSVNSVLNMIAHFNEEQIEVLLKSNLGYFQAKGKAGFNDPAAQSKIKHIFLKKKTTLEKLGFIEADVLTDKGKFATYIYSNEIVLTEVFYGTLHNLMDEFQVLLFVATLVYEPRRADQFGPLGMRPKGLDELIKWVKQDDELSRRVDIEVMKRLVSLVYTWYDQKPFLDLLKYTNLLEGDIIRLFRQIIDTLNQIYKATYDQDLRRKIETCVARIDREFVAVSFD